MLKSLLIDCAYEGKDNFPSKFVTLGLWIKRGRKKKEASLSPELFGLLIKCGDGFTMPEVPSVSKVTSRFFTPHSWGGVLQKIKSVLLSARQDC